MEHCSFINVLYSWIESVHIECCLFNGILITPQKEQPAHYHYKYSIYGGTRITPIFVSSSLVVPAVLSIFPPPHIKMKKKWSGHARLC